MNNKSNIKSNKRKLKEYNCWLQYRRLEDKKLIKKYSKWCTNIVSIESTPVVNSALNELSNGIRGMLGIKPCLSTEPQYESFIIIGTFGKHSIIDDAVSQDNIAKLNEEGYIIRDFKTEDKSFIMITAKTEKGLLYGTYALLRHVQMMSEIEDIFVLDNPRNPLRIINQWDNIDGSIERGYAGMSILYENNEIVKNMDRVKDYARLLSSVGINGIVINNVNVHKFETRLITKDYLPDVARLAEVFRYYGIKTYLSINFASPIEIGKLNTADPLDLKVRQWWCGKAEEIYSYIPDFGGFLVKADSEFRPGPFTYNRNHAEGANMLAEALRPFGGVVIWRCFVYNCQQDWRDQKTDRAKAAYDNFKPLDGMFDENVILQIKNGPMDFQVREPVSPLFGGLNKTNHILELQITQEYTGQQKHLCYLIPMWKEVLDFDTYAKGKGSTVKDIVNGSLFNNKYGGIAGVSNIGNDENWTGFQMAQANFYGFGRLSWNPDLTCKEITEEWVMMTYSNDTKMVETISEMLLNSWRIYENYTSPLGIGWMVNPNHHFGPNVDGYEYSKWGTYHRADWQAIGVDRTIKSGTGYTAQYHEEVAEMYENMDSCPEELLLFFHRVPYKYRLKSGETLIQYIYNSHFKGVEQVEWLREKWLSLQGKVEQELFEHVLSRLEGQIEYAKEWRDVINSYFYRKTGIKDELERKIY